MVKSFLALMQACINHRADDMRCALAITFLLTATVSTMVPSDQTNRDVAKMVFGRADLYDCYRNAETVVACRLSSRPLQAVKNPEEFWKLEDTALSARQVLKKYERGTPRAVSSADAEILSQILTNPVSYAWNSEAGIVNLCFPRYDVLLLCKTKSASVYLVLAFDCNKLSVLSGDGDEAVRVNVEDDFGPARSKLLEVFKRVFHDDKEIQLLDLG